MQMAKVDAATLTVILLYSTLAITGLLGNLWVMFTVSSQLVGCSIPVPSSRHRPLKTVIQASAYIYLLLLSVVDLISFVSVPLLVTDIIENRFPFGIGLCKLLFLCEGMNKSLSPLVLTALSIDRSVCCCVSSRV